MSVHIQKFMFYCLCITAPLCPFFTPLQAQDSSYKILPNPETLDPDWWNYFNTSGFTLESRIKLFGKTLDASVDDVTAEKKQHVQALISRIKATLDSYRKEVNKPPPFPIEPTTVSTTYTIHSVMELHRKIKKGEKKYEEMEKDKKKLEKVISTSAEKLREAEQGLLESPESSESKYIHSLEVILYQAEVALGQQRLNHIAKASRVNKEYISQFKEELRLAEHLISSSTAEERAFQERINKLSLILKKTVKALKKWELQAEGLTKETNDFTSQVEKLFIQSHILESKVEEALSKERYIQAQLLYNLSHVINRPETLNIDILLKNVPEWEKNLNRLTELGKSWKKQSYEMQQSAAQLVSKMKAEDGRSSEVVKKTKEINELIHHIYILDQTLMREVSDNVYLLTLLNNRADAFSGNRSGWGQTVMHYIDKWQRKVRSYMAAPLFSDQKHPINLWSIILSLLAIAATLYISNMAIRKLSHTLTKRKKIERSIGKKVSGLLWWFLITLGFLFALLLLGFDLSKLWLLVCALAIGLGFGLKDLINNFVSGVILLFETSIKVGDFVELESGISGEVRGIYLLNTRILTNDGNYVLITNSQMISRSFINWTYREPYRRFLVDFSVAYGQDKELVEKVVIEAAKRVSTTLSKIGVHDPEVYLSGFNSKILNFQLAVWVNERATRKEEQTRSKYMSAIETALQKHGIRPA